MERADRARTIPNETAQPGARFAGALGDALVLIPIYIGVHVIGAGRGFNLVVALLVFGVTAWPNFLIDDGSLSCARTGAHCTT